MESSEWDDFAGHSPPDERVIRLRALNDRFREKFIGGQVLITTGIEALGLLATTDILDRVRGFYRDEAAFDLMTSMISAASNGALRRSFGRSITTHSTCSMDHLIRAMQMSPSGS